MKTKYLVLSDVAPDKRFLTFRKAFKDFKKRVRQSNRGKDDAAQLWREYSKHDDLIFTSYYFFDKIVPARIAKASIRENY